MKDTAYDNIKSNKKTRFHYLSLENTFLEKPQEWGRGGAGGCQVKAPPIPFRINLSEVDCWTPWATFQSKLKKFLIFSQK